MPKQSEDNGLYPKASVALYRTRDLLFRCEDRTVGKFGLTAEQYSVLAAIKQLDDPVRPTDVGRLLDHKVNTISMIVDRMVNAGLVDRVRDLADRREVRLIIAPKGEKAFKPAHAAATKLSKEMLAPLSQDEVKTLIRLLETIRTKAHKPPK